MCIPLFHKYSKWEAYEQAYKYIKLDGTIIDQVLHEKRASRVCAVCGKIQDRKVNEV